METLLRGSHSLGDNIPEIHIIGTFQMISDNNKNWIIFSDMMKAMVNVSFYINVPLIWSEIDLGDTIEWNSYNTKCRIFPLKNCCSAHFHEIFLNKIIAGKFLFKGHLLS